MQVWLMTIVLTVLAAATALASPKAIHLEAADAQLFGPTVSTSRPGFSGRGYVTGFQKDGDRIVFHIPDAQAGLYDVNIRYSSPSGPKGYDLVVNGAKNSGMFAPTGNVFATQAAGRVELQAGANTLEIQKGWGYYDIDAVDLVPAPRPPRLKRISSHPVDPQATAATRALLASLVRGYGRKTLSGQYDQADTDYIHAATGRIPAILGGDFIEYSPSRLAHGSDPKGETERMIQAARAGQIVTMSWHWNAPTDLLDTQAQPWWRGFYTDATTFDVQKALADPNSDDYKLLLRDMDAIAAQLQKFADAGVPVLWRPLHEAEGGWFWWGAKGPEPFKALWRLMYDRFTNVHHLHNLIWVDCSGMNADWYPGDAYVDVIGIDAYPSDVADPLSSTWDTLLKQYDGRKMLALTEFGGVPNVEKMRRFGVRWSYWVSWTGDLGPRKLTKEALTRIYQSKDVVNSKPPGH